MFYCKQSFSVVLKYSYFLNVDDTIKKSHCNSGKNILMFLKYNLLQFQMAFLLESSTKTKHNNIEIIWMWIIFETFLLFFSFWFYVCEFLLNYLVPVDLLYEIRTGKNTTVFKEQGLPYSEDCCFSLIVGPNYESIDLVATSSDEANIWITGLRLLNQKSGMLFTRSGLL